MAKKKIEDLRCDWNHKDHSRPVYTCWIKGNKITRTDWNTDYVLFLEKRILKLQKKLKKCTVKKFKDL